MVECVGVQSVTVTARALVAVPASVARLALASLVDMDVAAVEHGAVELLLGAFGILLVFEGDEAEAAGTTCVAVGDDLGLCDFTVGSEGGAQGLIGGVPT